MARGRSLRSELYHDARILGDVQAAARGPIPYAKRYARRKVYSRTSAFTGSILRPIYLSK